MSEEQRTPPAPPVAAIPKPAAGSAPRPAKPRKKWTGPPPPKSSLAIWIVLGAAVILAVALVATLHYVFVPRGPAKVLLADEFRDEVNEMADFVFRPPRHWQINDRREPYTYYVMGPRDEGYSPLMIFTSLAAPGQLGSYVEEHKKRTQFEDPSVKFLPNEEDDSIDGCRARRLEFECDYTDDAGKRFHLHALQFFIKDPVFPVFYKITCYAPQTTYAQYVPLFEASAHTFRRRGDKQAKIKFLPPDVK